MAQQGLVFIDETIGIVNHFPQVDDVLLQGVAHLVDLHQRVTVVIVVYALGADGGRASFAEEVDYLCWMLWTRNTLQTAVEERLGIIGGQEVDDLVVPSAFHCLRLHDLCLAVRTMRRPLYIHRLAIFSRVLAMQVNDLDEALAAEGAPAVLEYERRPELKRFQALLLALLVQRSRAVQTLNSIERIATVVAKQQIIHLYSKASLKII